MNTAYLGSESCPDGKPVYVKGQAWYIIERRQTDLIC